MSEGATGGLGGETPQKKGGSGGPPPEFFLKCGEKKRFLTQFGTLGSWLGESKILLACIKTNLVHLINTYFFMEFLIKIKYLVETWRSIFFL